MAQVNPTGSRASGRRGKHLRWWVGFGGTLLAVAALMGALSSCVSEEEKAWAAQFDGYVDTYLASYDDLDLEERVMEGSTTLLMGDGISELWAITSHSSGSFVFPEACVRGKLIVVREDRGELDAINRSLVDLRAASPEEVRTLVVTSYGEKEVGEYTSGAKAYQKYCDVTVFDPVGMTHVAVACFCGSWPPEHKSGAGAGRGGDVDPDEIVAFIRSIPQE